MAGRSAPLAAVIAEVKPDLILHFGVSSRARGFEIEQRAHNACRSMPDAAGCCRGPPPCVTAAPTCCALACPCRTSCWRSSGAAFRLRLARCGAYLCNAVLYHSLQMAADKLRIAASASCMCRPAGAARRPNRGRVGACPLTWPQAVEGGLEIIAGCLGRPLPKARAHAVPARACRSRAPRVRACRSRSS
jgi:hypothetical protein